MARGVLGNDPFKRGAAVRDEPARPATESTSTSPTTQERRTQPSSPPPRAKTAPAPSGQGGTAATDKAATRPSSSGTGTSTKEKAAKPAGGKSKKASVQPPAAKAKQQSSPQAKAPPVAHDANEDVAAADARGVRAEPSAQDERAAQPEQRTAKARGIQAAPSAQKERSAPPEQRTPDARDVRAEHPAARTRRRQAEQSATPPRPVARAAEDTAGTEVLEPASEPSTRARAISPPGSEEVEGVITATTESHRPSHDRAPSEPSFRRRAVNALVLGRGMVAQASSSAALGTVLGAAGGLIHALRTGLGTAAATRLDDYGKDPELTQNLDVWSRFLYDRYWRVQVDGADRLPAGPALLVANHSGAVPIDGPVLQTALLRERADLREPRWLVEDQVFHSPFLGTLLNRLGAVRACPENALRLLGEQRPVIVFPEGFQGISKPFSERYRLMRFGRGGFVKIALRARVPIIPVAIVGAEEAMPLLARLPGRAIGFPYLPLTSPVPLPSRWTIRFGDPLDVSGHPAEAADDLVLVHRLNERTRDAIQGMLESMLKARTSVFA